jgi:hypothetical protein
VRGETVRCSAKLPPRGHDRQLRVPRDSQSGRFEAGDQINVFVARERRESPMMITE